MLAQIANEMVRLFKEQFGRGPTRARTHWCAVDTLVDGLSMEMFVFYPVGEEDGKPSRSEISVQPRGR